MRFILCRHGYSGTNRDCQLGLDWKWRQSLIRTAAMQMGVT